MTPRPPLHLSDLIIPAIEALAGRFGYQIALIIVTIFLTIGLCAHGAEWRMAEVTAYCPCALCCGDSADGRTANMTRTDRVPYNFAADRSLPFGTRIFIPRGLGVLDRVRADERTFVVDDRGGALDAEARRYGTLRLDLRVKSHAWAVRFGRRMIPVFVNNYQLRKYHDRNQTPLE